MLPERTHFARPDVIRDPLYVVSTVFNPVRFRTRWKLHEDFSHWTTQTNAAVHYTCEVAFGDREFVLPDSPTTLRLRTSHELWLKERALNLMVQRLPADWKYVAWVDADVHLVREDWADETRHALQHFDVVQMFSQAQDLGPNHELLAQHRGFVDHYLAGGTPDPTNGGYGIERGRFNGALWHPGFAWAMTRRAWNAVGGLYDTAIVGSADSYMAWGLVGRVRDLFDRQKITEFHPNYQKSVLEWQARAERSIHRNIGVVPGLLLHRFHGSKKKRNYIGRNDLLIKSQFDPLRDIHADWQGLWELAPPHGADRLRRIQLRNDLRAYNRARDEDGTEV